MFLLTSNFVKNSDISPRILLIVLKSVVNQTSNGFNSKFIRLWKDQKRSYQVGEVLPFS